MSNLPPGTTLQDVEQSGGGWSYCRNCGRDVETQSMNEEELCPRCAHRMEPEDREDR